MCVMYSVLGRVYFMCMMQGSGVFDVHDAGVRYVYCTWHRDQVCVCVINNTANVRISGGGSCVGHT